MPINMFEYYGKQPELKGQMKPVKGTDEALVPFFFLFRIIKYPVHFSLKANIFY